MKYSITFSHMVNARRVDCKCFENLTLSEKEVNTCSYLEPIICPRCGNALYVGASIKRPVYERQCFNIDWNALLYIENEKKKEQLIAAIECAGRDLQYLLKNFLLKESNFGGFLLSGNHGCQRGLYLPETRQIYLRIIDPLTLYHELGHAVAYLNKKLLIEFNEAFAYESNDNGIKLKLKTEIEKRTKLEEKYNKMIELGFPHSKSVDADEAFWEYFELKLNAQNLYADVLDIFGAITDKKYKSYTKDFGHGKSYWKRINAKQDEVYANIFSLFAVADDLQLNILRNILPNTTAACEKTIKDLSAVY